MERVTRSRLAEPDDVPGPVRAREVIGHEEDVVALRQQPLDQDPSAGLGAAHRRWVERAQDKGRPGHFASGLGLGVIGDMSMTWARPQEHCLHVRAQPPGSIPPALR